MSLRRPLHRARSRRVWPSYGLPGIAVACRTHTPAGARALVVVIEAFDAELVRRAGFALADALDLGRIEE
jgi:hypothetical protein